MLYIREVHDMAVHQTQGRCLHRRNFIYSSQKEPHAARKTVILEKHPEIKALMRPEPLTKWVVFATIALQVCMAVATRELSWPAYIAAVYVVGATANHSLFLAIHEFSHNLGSRSIIANKLMAVAANLPIGIAYCISFKPYHMEHHRYQGEEDMDTDIPTALEGWCITKTSLGYADHTMRKAAFVFMQIFAYAFRPMLVKPGLITCDRWLLCNWTAQLVFNLVMARVYGPRALLYFLISTFFAGSIHPTAGHFIAEHYVVEGRTETYSYYGPLNYLCYNVGYHNEHHDFPNIPWTGLPKVRQLAPEFYESLPQCPSWPGAIIRYIFDDSVSPFSRVKRATMGQSAAVRDHCARPTL
jgi:sphingolipid delta-4 desaturase